MNALGLGDEDGDISPWVRWVQRWSKDSGVCTGPVLFGPFSN